jgi:mono/diheme cytochrome c family protein
MKKLITLLVFGAICVAFTTTLRKYKEEKPVHIPASRQRSGDSAAGYAYLTTGDYLKSGIPYNFFLLGVGKNKTNFLQRKGLNAEISYEYTAVKAPNGQTVIAPNCLQCHAQVFDSTLYIGLGNTMIDFTENQKMNPRTAALTEQLLQKGDPKNYTAAEPFLRVVKAISGQLYTQVRGVNAADRLAAVLVAHRDRNTFQWSDTAMLDIPQQVIPSDVPPWWLLKKKHAMFYNGFGRGDFGRFLMASNLLTVNDTAESREVDSHINDVLAYIYSLEPPKYPGRIDRALARQGGTIFVQHCSKCHGNYGEGGDYPNLLIPESIIGTDSFLYKSNYQSPQFVEWFNSSWFAQGDHPARLEPFNGYIAPPLDGIWITAPYLHNGSVPTLEAVLNSRLRPKYWSRDFNHPQYDYVNVGWKYTTEPAPRGTAVYNTGLPGYGNYGHTFGDRLSDRERKAVIEYLKTL